MLSVVTITFNNFDELCRTVASVPADNVEHYRLGPEASILDVGAAKGFLMHDFLQVLPRAKVRGLDVSRYAKENAHGGMGELIDMGSAEKLPYPDKSFDLVVSINSIHNLPLEALKRALREM